MPSMPFIPSVPEMGLEAQIESISQVTDETLRWIITIYMAGYHTTPRETAQKVMHAMANMAGLPDKLFPIEVLQRINDMTYEVLVDIAASEVAKARSPVSNPGNESMHS